MKFHYWKSLLGIFFVAILIWIFLLVAPIDPLTLTRLQNDEVIGYLTEAKNSLTSGQSAMSQNVPIWLKNSKQNIDAALVVLGDQSAILKQIADAKFGPDILPLGATLASIVAIFGTLSTIILSWRKDMRDARREIERLQSKAPNIELI